MCKNKFLIPFFCLQFFLLLGQNAKKQLIGRVVDINKSKGIEGVAVQLLSTGVISYTDSEGKFKFTDNPGFIIGEPNYSFLIQKEGYLTVGSTNNMVMFGSGAINNLAMKPDLDKFIWLTIKDGVHQKLLKEVEVQIRDSIKKTNANGKVKFNLAQYGFDKIKATLRLKCYYNKVIEVYTKGEQTIELIPSCESTTTSSAFDVSKAQQTLDRALKYRDGSVQGQNEAIESLLAQGYIYKKTNFDGVSLAGAKILDTDLSHGSFRVSELQGTDFSKSIMNSSNFNFANIESAIFNNVIAEKTFFQYVQGAEVQFQKANLFRSSFFLSDLSGADFTNANLKGVCLAYCNLTGVNFSGADLTDAYLFGSILNNANFKDAIIKNTVVSAAVADTISFSKEQLDELSRVSPFTRYVTLEIHNELSTEIGYDWRHPTFKGYYSPLQSIFFTFSSTLKFRDKESINPIGAFKNFTADGPNSISQRHWFDSKFWATGNRGFLLKKNLMKDIEFLKKSIDSQKLVEGSGIEIKKLIAKLRAKHSTAFKSPLKWDKDAQLVFMFAEGLKDPSRMKLNEWESASKNRCAYDVLENTKNSNSWESLYPKIAKCAFMPYEHLKIYRSWTIERARKLKVKVIDIPYRTTLSKIEAFKAKYQVEKAKNKGLLFNTRANYGDDGISRLFNNKNLPYKKSEFFMEQPITNDRMLLKLPTNKMQYFIDVKSIKIPKLSKGVSSYRYPTEFVVRYRYDGLTTEESRYGRTPTNVLKVEPTKAFIKIEGKVIWEGKIFKSEKPLYDGKSPEN
ncbi:MAG: hypothetical protein COA50_16055 [Flavobacteriaceae bacterium]|nr:MAG: hypothetical protein COA50_16055 [Flavobacteriaceae bacterium]